MRRLRPSSIALLIALVIAQLPAAVPTLAASAGPPRPHAKRASVAVAAPMTVAAPTAPPAPAIVEATPAPTLAGPMPTPTIPPKPVPPPPTTPTPIAETQFSRIINTNAAAMRTSPSGNASIITRIPHGQIAGIVNISLSGTWYRVTYRGKTGYIPISRTQPISIVGTTLASQYVRVIVVARQQQHIEVWDHGQLMIISAVTTGRPELPTPLGTTKVRKMESPHLFQSPWQWPNQYWYPPGWAHYAVMFRAGGYYFHDTRARPENGYGIGTNVPHIDRDGVERTGSRGCVNTPYWAVRMLYGWAVVGDPVVVVDG